MFAMDQNKTQSEDVPRPEGLPADVIVSPDTLRENRIPPGQSRTRKWPILDASGAPAVNTGNWMFFLRGLVNEPQQWDYAAFKRLQRVKVYADFHCVTRWSRLGNLWEGVSTRNLVELAGGLKPGAQFALAYGYDGGWSTNMPLQEFLAEDALVAFLHDGEPLTPEHGGPARLIVPRLYAWKSAKWAAGVEILDSDRPGFWERNGYHNHGDPWTEERYGFNSW